MSIFISHLETLCGISLHPSIMTLHPLQKWMDEKISSVFSASKGTVQLISLIFVQWLIRTTNPELSKVNEKLSIVATGCHTALRLQKGKDLTAFLRTPRFICVSWTGGFCYKARFILPDICSLVLPLKVLSVMICCEDCLANNSRENIKLQKRQCRKKCLAWLMYHFIAELTQWRAQYLSTWLNCIIC